MARVKRAVRIKPLKPALPRNPIPTWSGPAKPSRIHQALVKENQDLAQTLSSLKEHVSEKGARILKEALERGDKLIVDQVISSYKITPREIGTVSVQSDQAARQKTSPKNGSQAKQDLREVDSYTATEILQSLQGQSYDTVKEVLEYIKDHRPPHCIRHCTNPTLPQVELSLGSNDHGSLQVYDFSKAAVEIHFITITTVKIAIKKYFQSTAAHFYVISEYQAREILARALDRYTEGTIFNQAVYDANTGEERARIAEIAGMAAIGLLYNQVAEHKAGHYNPDRYFYAVAREFFYDATEVDPLRAMKIRALLAMYNLLGKARSAIIYVAQKLGGGTTDLHAIDRACSSSTNQTSLEAPGMDWDRLLGFARYFYKLLFGGSLLTLHITSRLAATLDYTDKRNIPDLSLLKPTQHPNDEQLAQCELVKITELKVDIMRTFDDIASGAKDFTAISCIRDNLSEFKDNLPGFLDFTVLDHSESDSSLKLIKIYLHLYHISAWQLLHRGIIANAQHLDSSTHWYVEAAANESLEATKMAPTLLQVILQDGTITQLWWMCLHVSYTSAIMVLYTAVYKIFRQCPSKLWKNDLESASKYLDTIYFYAKEDDAASGLRDTVANYIRIVEALKDSTPIDEFVDTEEDFSIRYVFTTPWGDSELEKAVRGLQQLIIQPFRVYFETIPDKEVQPLQSQDPLIASMEASVGVPHEWQWDFESNMQSLCLDVELHDLEAQSQHSQPTVSGDAAEFSFGNLDPIEDLDLDWTA
ncbi:hypothetical protein N0V90_013120 [Kalmusia sp. IMI 367209]|nr:hypothetical protein N0V90_013120 [Kalmusia sp. IMI 367209]